MTSTGRRPKAEQFNPRSEGITDIAERYGGMLGKGIEMDEDCNMVAFAKEELRRIRSGEPDEMQDAMDEHILTMVRAFADEGHSGFSASYALGILQKVLAFEPVTPLTGENDEWVSLDYGDEMLAQNKRCGRVFRRADGTAYDSEAVVFRDPDGSCFINRDSSRDIAFPYVPKRQYVDRP